MTGLKSSFLFSALAVCINAAVSLASVPYITRQVSPSDYGHISLFILFFYLFAFVDGIRPVIIRSVHTKGKEKSDFFRSCHIFSWLCGAVLSVVSFILLMLFYHHRLSALEILFVSLCALFCIPMNNEAAFLEAGERIGFVMMVRSAGWVLFYASFIFYAAVGAAFECYALSVAGMNVFLLICYRVGNSRESRSGQFRFAVIREMMTKIRQVILFNLYATLMSSLDRLFISRLLPLQLLAHYSVQYEFGFNWNTLVHTAARVLYPHLSRGMAEQDPGEMLLFWVHMNKLIFFAVFSLTLAGAAFSAEIIRLYAGEIYAEHHYIFRFVMLGVSLSAAGVMATVFQRALGDFASQEKAYGIAALTGIVLVYPLVKTFGILGAALVYLAVRIGDILLVLKMRRDFFPDVSWLKHLILWPMLFALSFFSLWQEYYAASGCFYAAFGAVLFNRDDLRYYIKSVRKTCL